MPETNPLFKLVDVAAKFTPSDSREVDQRADAKDQLERGLKCAGNAARPAPEAPAPPRPLVMPVPN